MSWGIARTGSRLGCFVSWTLIGLRECRSAERLYADGHANNLKTVILDRGKRTSV
jgi:hypothetical protein